MEKDYAKRFVKRPPKKRMTRLKLVLVGFVVLLLIATVVSMVRHWHQSSFQIAFAHFRARFARHVGPKLPVAAVSEDEKKIPALHFSFYKELANMQVASDVAAGAEDRAPVQKGYYLQFGAFKELPSASQLRLSLLLAGINVNIERKGEVHNLLYLVQQGPYASLNEVKMRQTKWRAKGIQSDIKKEEE